MSEQQETKQEKFVRLAEMRVNKALKAIDLIGNLGGPNYGKTEEQVDAINLALSDAVVAAVNKLQSVKTEKATFSLA